MLGHRPGAFFPPTIRPSVAERFWAKVAKSDEPGGCWLWEGAAGSNGYGNFWLGRTNVSAHRVAFELTFGPIPAGLVVCHTCDAKLCVKPLHLFAGTYADNERDKMAKGRQANGERQGLSKLTAADVVAIRALRGRESTRAIARTFGIAQTSVRDVLSGRTWSHVP